MYLQECNKNRISWFLVEGLAVCRTPVATKKRFSFTTCFSKNLNKKHPLIRDPFLCSKFTSSNSLLSQKNDLMSQTPPKKVWSEKNWLVVSTPSKNMSQNGFIFPNFRGANKEYLSCHHPEIKYGHQIVLHLLLTFWVFFCSQLPSHVFHPKRVQGLHPYGAGEVHTYVTLKKLHVGWNVELQMTCSTIKNQLNVGKYTIHGWYGMVWVDVDSWFFVKNAYNLEQLKVYI